MKRRRVRIFGGANVENSLQQQLKNTIKFYFFALLIKIGITYWV
jgi:hypothetical protein